MKLVRLTDHLLVNVDNIKVMQIAQEYDCLYLYIDNDRICKVKDNSWEHGKEVLDEFEKAVKEDNDKELWQD